MGWSSLRRSATKQTAAYYVNTRRRHLFLFRWPMCECRPMDRMHLFTANSHSRRRHDQIAASPGWSDPVCNKHFIGPSSLHVHICIFIYSYIHIFVWDDSWLINNNDQSDLVKDRIALKTSPKYSFLFAMWQHIGLTIASFGWGFDPCTPKSSTPRGFRDPI